jgi:hypothetical protein
MMRLLCRGRSAAGPHRYRRLFPRRLVLTTTHLGAGRLAKVVQDVRDPYGTIVPQYRHQLSPAKHFAEIPEFPLKDVGWGRP